MDRSLRFCSCHADDQFNLRLFSGGWRSIAISFHGFLFWASDLRTRLTILSYLVATRCYTYTTCDFKYLIFSVTRFCSSWN